MNSLPPPIEFTDFVVMTSTMTKTHHDRIEGLRYYRANQIETNPTAPTKQVLVSGGGPAGLMHAISACLQGYKVRVLEKRGEVRDRRPQIVALKHDSVAVLSTLGVLDILEREGKIVRPPVETPGDQEHTQSPLLVSIGDLEMALEAVLREIDPTATISYGCHLGDRHDGADHTFTIDIKNNREEVVETLSPDFLFIAEGKHSSTAESFGFRRVEVMPPIYAIAGFGVSQQILNQSGRARDVRFEMYRVAMMIYYFTAFLFESIRVTCFGTSYRMSFSMATPLTNYMGVLVSQERLAPVIALKQEIADLKGRDRAHPSEELKALIRQKEGELNGIICYWANIGYFQAVALSQMNFMLRSFGYETLDLPQDPPFYVPYTDGDLVEMSSSHIDHTAPDAYIKTYHQTGTKRTQLVIPCGDARSTVDFSTGLGLTNVIRSSYAASDLLQNASLLDLERATDEVHAASIRTIASVYTSQIRESIQDAENTARNIREGLALPLEMEA